MLEAIYAAFAAAGFTVTRITYDYKFETITVLSETSADQPYRHQTTPCSDGEYLIFEPQNRIAEHIRVLIP